MTTRVLEVRPADLVAAYYTFDPLLPRQFLWRAYINYCEFVETRVEDEHLKLFLVSERDGRGNPRWSLHDQYGQLHHQTTRITGWRQGF